MKVPDASIEWVPFFLLTSYRKWQFAPAGLWQDEIKGELTSPHLPRWNKISLTLFQRNGKVTAHFICQCSTLTYFRTLLRNSLISVLACIRLSFPTPPLDRCACVNCQDLEKWHATQVLRCQELTVENKIAWRVKGNDLFLDFQIHFKTPDSENSNIFFLIYVSNSSTANSVPIAL